MDQRGEQFVPRVLAITVGTTVEFPNNDVTFHNVFSLSRVKHFDLGRYKPGKSGTVLFDRPGIVPVFCDIHSHMSAYILVFSHPFFSLTDDAGDYVISGVPAGAYTVLVWSELGQRAAETRDADGHGDDRGRLPGGPRRFMSLFSSLTNRIFLGTALLVLAATGRGDLSRQPLGAGAGGKQSARRPE